MWRAASAAKRIISTAPIAKLGPKNAFALPPSARLASAASRSACWSKPEVPMTA
jgi:hypothetical protein